MMCAQNATLPNFQKWGARENAQSNSKTTLSLHSDKPLSSHKSRKVSVPLSLKENAAPLKHTIQKISLLDKELKLTK